VIGIRGLSTDHRFPPALLASGRRLRPRIAPALCGLTGNCRSLTRSAQRTWGVHGVRAGQLAKTLKTVFRLFA
jgi:hypothetical protein